jgi:hypothetical protein
MFHEVSMDILPPHSLAETLGDWGEIGEQLAEPNRKRLRNASWAAFFPFLTVSSGTESDTRACRADRGVCLPLL